MNNEEKRVLTLTEHEVMEIKHSLFYVNECNHGTVGHNQLLLIAKLATYIGITIQMTDGIPVFMVCVPGGVEVKGWR